MNVVILGRMIGVCDGWDAVSDDAVCFYDYESSIGLPFGDLTFDSVTGVLEYTDDAGDVTTSYDAIEILSSVPRQLK